MVIVPRSGTGHGERLIDAGAVDVSGDHVAGGVVLRISRAGVADFMMRHDAPADERRFCARSARDCVLIENLSVQ